jgi:hypothetical protein
MALEQRPLVQDQQNGNRESDNGAFKGDRLLPQGDGKDSNERIATKQQESD